MLFDRRPRLGAHARALVLAASLAISGQAWAASPPASGRGAQEGTEFQTYLNAAVRLYENLEYEEALEKLERAQNYVRGVEDDVTLSLYKGIILADLRRQDQSQAAFRAGLLLSPEAKLPLKVSPKVARDFEALRQNVRRELEALQAKQGAQQQLATTRERPGTALAETSHAPAAGEASPPAAPTAGIMTGATAPRSRVLPYSLLGGGAVLAGAGAVLGLSALSFNDRKRDLTADEAVKERDRASTKLTIGTVLVGGGLAALGTGVALLVMPQGTTRPGTSSPGASLQITPLPGGLALGTLAHF